MTNKKKSGLFKNKEKFSFIIDKSNKIITSSQSTIESDCGNFKLYIDGIIYNNDKDQLISGFITDGIDFISELEGNFVIFLIIGLKCHFFTDKINSKKVFYAQVDDSWHISNNIDNLPKERCQISIDGIACYIANGAMLNYLTLFEGIKCAERSSIYSFDDGKFIYYKYWDYIFDYSHKVQSDEELHGSELEKLLIRGIERRYDKYSRTAVSLSAGYDARGILGILHNFFKATDVYCFSYALNEHPPADSDAYLAGRLAANYRYSHRIIKSYRGNLLSILIENALEGKCITNFSDELDAWHDLAHLKQYDDVFAGDMSFGAGENERTIDDVLTMLHIRSETGLNWLKGYLSNEIYYSIYQSIKRLNVRIIKTAERFSHLLDKTDFLYFDQRINHVLLPWRENICSQTGYVHLPFLDGDILNYMLKLPGNLRDNKLLYRKTISRMYPDLFSIPRAKVLGYKVNWAKEIASNKNALIEMISNTDSRLNEFISKEEIIRMIKKLNPTFSKLRSFIAKSINFIRRRVVFFDIIMTKIFGPIQRILTADVFIIRILLLHIYLAENLSEYVQDLNNSENKVS